MAARGVAKRNISSGISAAMAAGIAKIASGGIIINQRHQHGVIAQTYIVESWRNGESVMLAAASVAASSWRNEKSRLWHQRESENVK